VQVTPEGVAWTCTVCDSANALERRTCSACGAPFAASLRGPTPARPPRDPGIAALLSLLLPGAGHGYLGMWGQAVARAVTSLWVVSVVLATALEQGLASPTPLLFGTASFALWAVGSHDAYRDARGEHDAVLLAGRALLNVVLGLILLSLVTLFVTALGARPAGP
jgi:hypothetical protein